eukprot:TRINITY_DN75922_c0_g1_i1.p1 TRINITY_DN75922_c0_g1~~TRINITY_DN75922_c0_g1_i1.p1  ORF type:complete len:326 (-),score=68.18 TRINITY_DN75922_c0_g1_i1:43-951(-)
MELDDDGEDLEAYLDSLELEPASGPAAEVSCASQPFAASELPRDRGAAAGAQEVPQALFRVVKSQLEFEELRMTLPQAEMTPHHLASYWEKEWGVPHATKIKFEALQSSEYRWLHPRSDVVPLQPTVVRLDCKGSGSILTSLTLAFRKHGGRVETTRLGDGWQWPTWNPQQVFEEYNKRCSQEQMERWRGESRQQRAATIPPVSGNDVSARPLNDPYARRAACVVQQPAVSEPVKVVPKVSTSPPPAPAKSSKAPDSESWSAQQQRLKREQREARLAENARRRDARRQGSVSQDSNASCSQK